jgi:hypothetical protein
MAWEARTLLNLAAQLPRSQAGNNRGTWGGVAQQCGVGHGLAAYAQPILCSQD